MIGPMTHLAVIHINIDPIALQVGNFSVHWYGVMYVVSFALGFRFGALPHLVARGVDRADAERMLFWAIVAGLVGARLYFDVQQPLDQFVQRPIDIIAVWQGGMDFFGALFGAVGIVAFRCWREKRSFWLFFDATVIFGVVAQPIGRIGNIINGDILGGPSNLPWATAYDNPRSFVPFTELGQAVQPAGAYEALCALGIGVLLFYLRRRGVRVGVLGLTYVAAYAITHFFLFFVRQTEPIVGLGLKQSQWTCLAMLVFGMPALYFIWKRSQRVSEPPSLLTADAS